MKPDILSDIERERIIAFNRDAILVNAVKKVLLESMYNNGVLRKEARPDSTRNAALSLAVMAVNGQVIASNEQLGEDLRGMAQAIILMEQGFSKLEEIKNNVPEKQETPTNPAV